MPGRDCDTCKHYRPFEGRLAQTFAKCVSPSKPMAVNFTETCRADFHLCGPTARWWEGKPPAFELVEDDPPRALAWPDEDEDS